MGFKISWIGFNDINKADVLKRLGLRDTGEIDEANEAPLSGAEFPGGWFILFSNDFEFAAPERLASLSMDCRIIACEVHEGIMVSGASSYERGARLWEMTHNSQNGIYDLSIAGSPPQIFQSIREDLMRKQEESGGEKSNVDYIFDIPVETAATVCGYRHDTWRYDWGAPTFTQLNLPLDC